jgi:hypothetical protein
MNRIALLTAGLAAALILALGSGTATAFPKLHECQHPMTTGEEAYDLHNISVRTACTAVRRLATFLNTPGNASKLYGCHRKHPNEGGFPFLRMHTFDGYRLKLTKDYEFEMYTGDKSFRVTGTDFPLNCT